MGARAVDGVNQGNAVNGIKTFSTDPDFDFSRSPKLCTFEGKSIHNAK